MARCYDSLRRLIRNCIKYKLQRTHLYLVFMFLSSLSRSSRVAARFPRVGLCRQISGMSSTFSQALDTSPPRHPISAGITSINRDLFRKTLPVVAARIPAAKTGSFLKSGELKKCVQSLALPFMCFSIDRY